MKMNALEKLHNSMRALGLDMQKFRVRTGAAEFECVFSTRDNPFSLALTSREDDPKFFLFEVRRGYFIRDYLGDQYADLRRLLFVDGHTGEPLIPKKWLEQLNATIPQTAYSSHVPDAVDIARLRPDIEETDKPFFDTWMFWTDGRGPSKENQKKTLYLLGRGALEYSRNQSASGKWSKVPTGRDWQR